MNRSIRWLLRISLPGLCLLTGCVAVSADESSTRYHYQYWVPALILLGGLLSIPIGFFWRRSDWKIGWGLMTVVPIAAFLLVFTMGFEQVTVDEHGFEVQSGFFSEPHSVKFDSVVSVRSVKEKTGGRRSRVIDVLYFDLKDGGAERYPISSDVKTEASKDIIQRAKARGIAMPQFR
jgi:hypothetical protein